MVRENRIKEYIFPSFSVNGSTFKTYTDHVLNGEVTKVRFQNITTPGSMWIADSGTDIEYSRSNNMTSGLAAFDTYPFVYGYGPTFVTGSPQTFFSPVTNSIVYLAGSGLTSGTGKLFGPVTVYYR